jgi:glycosyltransferase involved in cell wall biosynthesis
MKFSIIFPVYNEEKIIFKTLKKICELNYETKEFEIIIIDDDSKDNTHKNIRQIISQYRKVNINFLKNENNLGRCMTREKGALNAKSNHLLFIDSRCLVDKNILLNLEPYLNKYKSVVGTAIIEPKRSIFDRINYLINKKIYYKYFLKKNNEIEINKNNFDEIPKGTGVFFCEKKIFLESQIENKTDKNASDDTKLLKNILKKTKNILKSRKIKVTYLNRTSFSSNIKHIYERGPKFVDYYFKPKRLYFKHLITYLIGIFVILISIIIKPKLILFYLISFIISIILISLYLSRNLKDFFVCLFLFPIVSISFGIGIIKGFILKLLKKL